METAWETRLEDARVKSARPAAEFDRPEPLRASRCGPGAPQPDGQDVKRLKTRKQGDADWRARGNAYLRKQIISDVKEGANPAPESQMPAEQ